MALRAGLAGLGMMGRHHKRLLTQLEGVDFVGIFDPALDNNSFADDASVFGTMQELIAQKLDYCVVAAPTMFHLELGLQLAAAGVHALIEKPVATNPPEAEQLVNAFAKSNLIGGVGHGADQRRACFVPPHVDALLLQQLPQRLHELGLRRVRPAVTEHDVLAPLRGGSLRRRHTVVHGAGREPLGEGARLQTDVITDVF